MLKYKLKRDTKYSNLAYTYLKKIIKNSISAHTNCFHTNVRSR
jgi:hypothetical protein